LKRKTGFLIALVAMLSTLLVPAGALAVIPTPPGTVTITDPVNATITRADTLDAITFDIEITSDNPAGHTYGVGLVFATSGVEPDFQVWYAESASIGAPDVGWWYQEYGAGWEACETLEASGTGITAVGAGAPAPGEKVFSVTIPTAELGGFGATYYYAIQVRTNLIGWYPAAYNWGPDVSAFAEVNLLVLNEDTGNLYGTIQAAINAASPSDTINVLPGTYPEDVTIDKSLTLVSAEGKDTTIINGQLGGQAAAVNVNDGVDDVVIGDTGQGFTINAAGLAAIRLVGSGTGNDNVTIRDNKLVASGEISAGSRTALSTGGLQSNHTIADNEFSGGANQLVYVNGTPSLGKASAGVDFTGNTFSGTATGAALGQEAADSTISGNTFATVTGYASLELWVDSAVTGNDFTADLLAGGVYVMDNTGFGPGIPGAGDYVLNIDEVLSNNFFLRAVVVENPGSSRLPAIWANIQDAVNAAVAGDTVDVIAGQYNENVVISADKDGLQLIGAGSGETFITPTSGQSIKLPGWTMLEERPLDGVRIQGFTLVTAGDSHAMLVGSGTPDETYYNTNLELEDIVVDGGQRGIGLMSVNGVTFANVHLSNIVGSPEAALELVGVYGLSFVDGSFEGNDIGILLQRTDEGSGEGYGTNGNIQIHSTNFCGNGIAIENQDSSTVIDATNNYWCHPSGPHASPGLGDPISGDVLYNPWLLEPGGATYDKTLALKDGWTLISTDNWVDSVALQSEEGWLVYQYTGKGQGYKQATFPDDLMPVEALYVKTVGGGGIGINYSAGLPAPSSKELEAGWNLISTATIGNARAILSPLRYIDVGDEQGVGLATLVSQGNYNQHTGSFTLATFGALDWSVRGPLVDTTLNPFDGYWVYMNADKSFGVIPE